MVNDIQCKKCGLMKTADEFHKSGNTRQSHCKECKRQWYVANAEQARARNKKYYAANADRIKQKDIANADYIKERRKKYRVANAESLKEINKRWRMENAQRLKDYKAQYKAKNVEEIKARTKRYYAEHAERLKAANQRWREDNTEYLKRFEAARWVAGRKEQAKQRHTETREHRQKLAKEWRLKNPGRANELAKQWREANIDRVKEREKQWRDANPDKIREKSSRRRMQKKDAPGSHTRVQWRALVNNFEGRCVCCGEHFGLAALTEDHVVPLRCGGSDYIENIQPLCVSCNSRKGARHSTDYRKKPFAGSGQQKLFG